MAATSTKNYDSSILIVGAGTWGCSTALHLARRGYKNITVLDAYEIPSPISAGNDINKIVEQGSFDPDPDEDSSYVSRTLLRLASEGWVSDPVFMPYYHDTGYIICAHTKDGLEQLTKREMLDQQADFEWLGTAEAFRATMPKGVLTGDFPGWKGGFKRTGAGWVFARGALVAAFKEAERLGVKFITGSKGKVTKLIEKGGDMIGALTEDGTKHFAETTVLAAGAQAPVLLDMKDQLRPTAWTLAHIKMSPEECELYKDLPVLFNIESGFFMEPDAEKHELKICDEHPGYCNWITTHSGTKSSVPFVKHQIPLEAETRVRDFLKDTMPQLSHRPFAFARICWCADTPDRNFLIKRLPEYKNLVLAVGGSGHGLASFIQNAFCVLVYSSGRFLALIPNVSLIPRPVDGYDNGGGGFSPKLKSSDSVAFMKKLSTCAHSKGIEIGLKNAGGIVSDTLDFLDWSVNEQCDRYDECDTFSPSIDAGKPVFHIEYTDQSPDIQNDCYGPHTKNFSTILKPDEDDLPTTVQFCPAKSS